MDETRNGKVRVVAQVPLIDGLQTPYHQFRDQFMRPNLPVLISGLMNHWRAFREWSSPFGVPDFDYLATRFGNSNVQVAECSTREFTDQKRVNMTVADYITYWKRHNSYKQDLDCAGSFLYLKDWHFVKDYPEYGPYSTPIFFMDDWLNLYLEHYQLHANEGEVETPGCLSDYRFVYMGPKGTWTPLHADVLRSYSWSSNICGKKLWHLLPPSETHLIFDRHMRSSVYNIYGDISVEEFPNFHKAGWLECTQEKGQILFVPSKWYHQVTNLEDTISINHNWINGYNLHWVWELILTDYKETRASIEDIRLIADDFEELCQRNLAENSGMNFKDLFLFLRRMMVFFLSYLHHNRSTIKEEKHEQEIFSTSIEKTSVSREVSTQVLFNLKSIRLVAQLLASVDTCEQCMLASPDEGEVESANWIPWVDNARNSEYGTFLSNLIGPCTSPDISGSCLCAPDMSEVSHRASLIDMECSKKGKSETSRGLLLQGTTQSISVVAAKVKTPTALILVIQAIIDQFRQAYQIGF
ncbi:hypothetical protein GOP47_0025023 [Adiantum capillus-veneris]|uniref:JmjC domain-containing protein n=1 Tax=Adiantum capillus-veneris TaxID=13818 RepID=A0A9D4U422_ADICA|nr:hypothetical protein GOP47_0025023 [Adiantum capillus-veneris]